MANLTLTKNPQKGKLTNSGTRELAKMKLISQIQTGQPFIKLFPINPLILQSIERSIEESGFDSSQVLHIWKEKNLLIDGHTRLSAAENCGLKQIPVFEHSFPTEEEALNYAINLQKNRRNLTDGEMMNCLDQLDQLKPSGRKSASNGADTNKGKSAATTAKLLGTSRSKIEKMRTIKNHAPPKVLLDVTDGNKSINKAYIETVEVRKKQTDDVSSQSPLPSQSKTGQSTVGKPEATQGYSLSFDENTIYLTGDGNDDNKVTLVTVMLENFPIPENRIAGLVKKVCDDLETHLNDDCHGIIT